MNEKVKLALERLSQNSEMQEEIKNNPPKSIDDLIVLAGRLGVELTDDDFKQSEDLSQEELKQAAGGSKFEQNMENCGFEGGFFCTILIAGAFWREPTGY